MAALWATMWEAGQTPLFLHENAQTIGPTSEGLPNLPWSGIKAKEVNCRLEA